MKADYSDAMATLERISEEIHQKRQLNRQLRERKLQRDITVSVGDCEDLDDVDGMVRDLAVGELTQSALVMLVFCLFVLYCFLVFINFLLTLLCL